jgi:hypothetical protein
VRPLGSRNAATPLQPRGTAASGDVAGHDGADHARRHRRRRHRTTLADLALALQRVDRLLVVNRPHHHGAWRGQAVTEPVGRAVAYLNAWQARDNTENHLGHAACRTLMAMQLAAEEPTP